MRSKDELRKALARYGEALKVRSQADRTSADLVNQDKWYRTTLRETLKKRKSSEEGGAYMTKDEMIKLMQWKLARGKWRPLLEKYIHDHKAKDIEDASRAVFSALDKATPSSSSSSAKDLLPRDVLKQLTKLKGIGPATASAVLAAYAPDRIPFLSDEAAVGVGNLGSKPSYTDAFLDKYVERMHARAREEGWDGGVDELERACYAAGVLDKYGDEKEGKETRRKKGAVKDVEALLDKARETNRAAGGTDLARPDAATAHGDDPEPAQEGDRKPKPTKKESASSVQAKGAKRRAADDGSRSDGDRRKSARLASK